MTEETETWRPLDVDTEDEIAEYDALHDGVPPWMQAAFWAWVKDQVTMTRRYPDGSGGFPALKVQLTEEMCQTLRIPLPDLRWPPNASSYGMSERGTNQLTSAMAVLARHPKPLQIADYLLAHPSDDGGQAPAKLETLLTRSKSAWTVGTRAGKPGLVRRVPQGVQVAADAVMAQSNMAGVRLAQAWEYLYGLDPKPSEAYRKAIQAIEDAAVPVVSPKNTSATLGTVLAQMEQQGDWGLPMDREHSKLPTGEVLIGLMRVVWHGQHDRHGGQPSAPGNVSFEEARVAVAAAVTLVDWFTARLVARKP